MSKRISHLAGAFTLAATALLTAGCGADTASGSNAGSAVAVQSVDGHDVLVDAQGHTLYTAAVEHGGDIRCVDTCVQFWKPLYAARTDVSSASPSLRGELGTVDRPDGTSQVTFEGLPLYTFTQEGSGELTGNGFTDDFRGTHFEWSAATPDASHEPATSSGSESSGSGRYDY